MDLRLGVGAVGVTYSKVLGERTYFSTTGAVSVNVTTLDQQRMSDDLVVVDDVEIDNATSRITAGSYVNHRFGRRHVNRSGWSAQLLLYDFALRAAPFNEPPLLDVASGSGHSSLLQLYSQSRLDLTPSLVLNLGGHATHFALTGAYALEPRVSMSIRWEFTDRQAVGLGYGLHSQIEDLRIYFARVGGSAPNTDLDFARACHGVLSYDVEIGDRSRVKAAVSRRREEVAFDESRAFSVRESDLFLLDVTMTYRRSRGRVSDVLALQVKNALAAKETVHVRL